MKKRKREKVQKGAKENHETLEIQSKKSIPSSHLILKKSQKKLKRLVRKCADVHFITIILLLSCWCVVIQVQSQTPKKAPIQFKGYSISFSPQKSLYLCFSFPNSTKEYSITSSSDGVSTIRFNELHFCSNPAGDARVLGFRAFNASSFNSSFSEGFNHMCAKVVFQRRNSAKRGVFSDVMSFADCPRNGTKFVSPLNAMELHLSISHFKQISPYYPSIKLLYKRGGKLSPAPVYGKGKGKMVVSDPYESEDSSDDDADFLAPSISPPPMLATGENRGDTDVEVSSLLPLDVAKPLSPLEGSGVNIVQLLSEDTAQIQYSPDHLLDDANNFLLDAVSNEYY
ncbi:hypothetical protein BVRB_4g091110 [Beta vulgaris subsp. vulgaris]|uniref:Uncharacterized protein n=1 Tax=Beta vulgaris subsp. vulgaris TaxID=3555 RepID=A0A0J8CGI9_BETVV|nr:hypothetical protein BVRB_4g091110 [Beta vulgaris subsp. vulgaris]